MDIHSLLSTLLILISIIVVYLRSRKDDEVAVHELEFSLFVGSIILVICIFLGSIVYFIIFNEKLFSHFDPTPRETLIFIQYYYTIIYYTIVILNKYVYKD